MKQYMLVLCLSVILISPIRAQQVDTPTIAITNITVIDGTGSAPQPNMTLLIKNGIISDLFPAGRKTLPEESRVLDMTGHFILPGLIDAHVHLTKNPDPEKRLKALLALGTTTVRDMGGDARTLSVLARDARLGGIQSPNIYYSAFLFGPSFLQDPRARFAARGLKPGEAPWMRVVTGHTDLSQVIAEAKGTGATGIKLYSAIEPGLLKQITNEAHRQGLKVWSHATIFPSKPSDAVLAGVDVLSHSGGLYPEAFSDVPSGFNEAITEWMPKQDFSIDPGDAPYDSLYHLMVNNGTILEPTFSAGKSPRVDTGQAGQSQHLAEAARNIDMSARRAWTTGATREAYEAGVTIAAGTDSDGSVPVQSEIETFVEHGFSPLDAIKAATLNNARAIGVEETHGSLEVGKRADFVLLSVNPLQDISSLRNIILVAKDGVLYPQNASVSNEVEQDSGNDREADKKELLRLNEELARSQIVDRDSAFIKQVALDDFRVLAPGGLIENKSQVIAGLSGWDATDVQLTGTEVLFYGDVALVMGRMDIDGIMKPVGRWGPLKYMSTWIRDGKEWRLLSRSLTPCIEILLKMGRC